MVIYHVERQKVTTGKAPNLQSSYTFALENRLPSRLASVLWVVVALSNAVAWRDASVPQAEGRRRTRQAKVLSFEAAARCYLMVAVEPVHFAKVRLCWTED
jgi:hypothetical protein